MKKRLSVLLAVLLLLSCMLMAVPTAQAEKATEKRAIAIVFDNSGSMYMNENLAWCRATYAMEVFASMLNEGDILQIYPMSPIQLGKGGTEYSMDKPLQITKAADASIIRNLYTPHNWDTPIESIGAAAEGLKKVSADKKYLIIITDGAVFNETKVDSSGKEVTVVLKDTQGELDKRIQNYASDEMTVMYLGMDTVNSNGKVTAEACDPSIPESEHYVEKIVAESSKVLSSLTEMCNLIFGRNTLPKKHIKNGGKTIKLDVSTKKLIVFVQGTNIEDLKVTGNGIGNIVGSPQQTKYAEDAAKVEVVDSAGNWNGEYYKIEEDTNLQGMMVTYDGSTAGNFDIKFEGTASSVEVYYEPDVEMMFKFTNAETGEQVKPEELYEGEYELEYGMLDSKSGKFVENSDLLGDIKYTGSYTVTTVDEKGNETPKTMTIAPEPGTFKGSEKISLKMGQKFEAELEVDYLNGYIIRKTTKDFGWPEDGITVHPKPIDDKGFRIEITGGASSYPLQQLEAGAPYKAVVYFNDEPLPAEYYNNSDKLSFTCDDTSSNAKIQVTPKEGYYELKLLHKDSNAPQNTKCGESEAVVEVTYKPDGSEPATKRNKIKYTIEDDFATLGAELIVPQDYIVIKDMADTQAMTVKLTLNGAFLTPEEFKAVKVSVDCGGINYELTPDEANSAYKIKILETDKISEGDYIISVNAQYTDSIGRVAKAETEYLVTLSSLPLWVKWAITLSILIILFIIIWTILHIRVLPTKAHTTKKLSFMTYDSEDVTRSANFLAEIKQGSAKFQTQFAGRKYGLTMDASPGKESYLYKGQKSRSAEISVASVRKFGPAKIQEAMIGSAKYVLDEDTGKLVPALPNMKPFLIKNGMMVKFSGSVQDAGVDKDFEVTSKINFKK